MTHDFKKFPELRNNQFDFYYFESPHKQITENFIAKVVDVHDGDTLRVEVDFRNFTFPIRLSYIAAPELGEDGGRESRDWLAEQVLGEEVQIVINPFNRVGKWGRLIGNIIHQGMNINYMSRDLGFSTQFGNEFKLWGNSFNI